MLQATCSIAKYRLVHRCLHFAFSVRQPTAAFKWATQDKAHFQGRLNRKFFLEDQTLLINHLVSSLRNHLYCLKNWDNRVTLQGSKTCIFHLLNTYVHILQQNNSPHLNFTACNNDPLRVDKLKHTNKHNASPYVSWVCCNTGAAPGAGCCSEFLLLG